MYVVVGGNEHHVQSLGETQTVFDGVKLHALDKSSLSQEIWWYRQKFEDDKYYFVKRDDPALSAKELRYCQD